MFIQKKVSLGLLSTMMAFGAIVSGCSEKKEEPAQPKSTAAVEKKEDKFIQVLVETGSPAFKVVSETAEEFRKKTGYEVKIDAVPYSNVHDKLSVDMTSNNGMYDVATIDILWFSTLGQGLRPIDDLMTKEVKDDLFPSLIDGGTVNNKVLGMPVWTNSKILLYRKDLFEDPKEKEAFKKQFGYDLKAPTTWKEYIDAAKFFTRDADQDGTKEMYGTSVFGLNNGDSVASWLDHAAQAGAKSLVIGDNGKAVVNSKPYVDALTFLSKMAREDKSTPNDVLKMASVETSDMFTNGKLSMMLAWAHFFVPSNDPAKSKVAGKVGAAPMISGESGVGVVPGPWYQVIPSSSKKQDAAKEYVKFIYERNELFMKALGVAARKSVFDQYGQKPEYAHLNALNTTLSAKQTQNRPVIKNWNEIENKVLVPAIVSVLSGAPAQEVMDKAAADIDKLQGK